MVSGRANQCWCRDEHLLIRQRTLFDHLYQGTASGHCAEHDIWTDLVWQCASNKLGQTWVNSVSVCSWTDCCQCWVVDEKFCSHLITGGELWFVSSLLHLAAINSWQMWCIVFPDWGMVLYVHGYAVSLLLSRQHIWVVGLLCLVIWSFIQRWLSGNSCMITHTEEDPFCLWYMLFKCDFRQWQAQWCHASCKRVNDILTILHHEWASR